MNINTTVDPLTVLRLVAGIVMLWLTIIVIIAIILFINGGFAAVQP